MLNIYQSLFVLSHILLFGSVIFAQVDLRSSTSNVISGGILNGRSIHLVQPQYPAAAKAIHAKGTVNVQVLVDENGDVISAVATSGHMLLRAAAVSAARQAKFSPIKLSGQAIKFQGVIVYNFVEPEIDWKSAGYSLGEAENEIAKTNLLERLAENLQANYPDQSKKVRIIIENFDKDKENANKQTVAITEIINSLCQSATLNKEAWNFELGLLIGRIYANPTDDYVLRNNLGNFKSLLDTASKDTRKETLDALTSLSEFADKSVLTRRNKEEIQQLLDELR